LLDFGYPYPSQYQQLERLLLRSHYPHLRDGGGAWYGYVT
jgi:hypothetical protein